MSTPVLTAVLAAGGLLSLHASAAAQTVNPQNPVLIPGQRPFHHTVYSTAASVHPVDVARSPLTGRFGKILAEDLDPIGPLGFAVDLRHCHVYVVSSQQIWRMDSDGSNRVLINANASTRGVAIDTVGDRLYYVNPFISERLRSCNLDGTDQRELAGFFDGISPDSVHVDGVNRRVYWWDSIYGGFRVGLIGPSDDLTCFKDLYFTGYGIAAFDVDTINGYLYWIATGGGDILRAPIPPDSADACAAPTNVAPPELVVMNNSGFNFGHLSVLPEPDSPTGGVVAWTLANGTLQWRDLAGTWPVPVHDSGPIPNVNNVLKIVVTPGPGVCFLLMPLERGGGSGRILNLKGAAPASPCIVRITHVNGRRANAVLFRGTLDERGALELELPTSPALSGINVRLEAIVFEPGTGRIVREEMLMALP